MSGKVVPTSGDIQFLSNVDSNAVCQVFGLGANSSFSSLVGTAYNPNVNTLYLSTDAAPTVPALSSLSLRFFAGASLFLTSPNTPTISSITTTGITPTLSGGSGSYYVALGTAVGGSNVLNWTAATSGTAISTALTAGTSYYISAFTSNLTTTTKSRVIRNSTVYTPLAAPVIANFTSLPNRTTQNITVNWAAVTGATVYDVHIGTTEVARDVTTTSKAIDISGYTGGVKAVKVQARNAINTSPFSTTLEFFFTTTPVSTTPSVTFSRSTTHSIVAVGAGGVSGGVSSGWTAGAGGPGGIVSLQSYASRSTLYYNVGGSGDGGASYGASGKGGGASAVYTETPDTIVIAGGGGGGGTIYNLALGADDFNWHNAICGPGGPGGNNAGNAPRAEGYNVTQLANNGGYPYYFSSSFNGGFGGDQSAGGAAAINGTYSNPSGISFLGVYDYNVNGSYSYTPTAGVNSSGGRGGALYWFMYCIGGGGGNGFKGGGGGGASTAIGGQHNGLEEFYGGYTGGAARRVIAGTGGGGGGSSWVNGGHGNPDGTTTHGSASDRSGLVFIAERK
jgi:hypothetical protein